jgi:hypothetical protein
MIVARGANALPGQRDIIVIGITPAVLRALMAQGGLIHLAQPAGLEYDMALILAEDDDAVVAFVKAHGGTAVALEVDGQTKES